VSRGNLLLATGLLSFLVFVMAGIPARVLAPWFSAEPLLASGYSGTVWNGRVEALRFENLVISDLDWRLRPLALLGARLALDVDGRLPDGFANGRIELRRGGRFTLNDFRLRSSLNALGTGLSLPLEGGPVLAEISSLSVAGGWFTRVIGTLQIDGLSLALPGLDATPPGLFLMTFDNPSIGDGSPLQGDVRGSGGILEIEARLTLQPPADYQLFGTALPLAGAPDDLVRALAMLGPRRADGSYEFGLSGSF
jgi:general secretion pathway protein N